MELNTIKVLRNAREALRISVRVAIGHSDIISASNAAKRSITEINKLLKEFEHESIDR